ncbi:zinc ABC transporter ATP-binding protein AztA [Arthrobacter sp. B0490]|uniref:zinc ABC transporter ATP-binding protein AztA n=1 Tax=Arthrobacter sp. B0490 TaxID=2058891 RepID=UPI000CE35E9C|nr:zinc ABC transporter ATP-binding protein AztA [Arthrobacter sp. B0490]
MLRHPSPPATATDARPIVLHGVWVDHDGVDALCGVSLTVEPARITVVTGANGSGKSTLLAVLAGLLVPRRGRVVLPVRSTALVAQRSEVTDRMPLTVHDVVSMGRWPEAGLVRRLTSGDRRIIDDCIGLVGLDGYARRPLHALSGGQRQRAFLAQGLARRADVILLDEPTTGLDAGTRAVVADLLTAERSRGAMIVCVSHDDVVLRAADRLVRLEAGRVVSGLEAADRGARPPQ